jgi:hypothetical protein
MVVAGIRNYDGKGNFTQRDYRGDSVPAEFAPKGQEQGTYIATSNTLKPDGCPVFDAYAQSRNTGSPKA